MLPVSPPRDVSTSRKPTVSRPLGRSVRTQHERTDRPSGRLTVGLRDVETSRGGLTGSMLDRRYRVGGIIARGGMSTVYRGTDLRLDRPVAIKVMSQQYV